MKVKEIMTETAVCCTPGTNLGQAVELMWVHNCGMLPVIGPDRKLSGIITDRDICIAVGTRNRLAGELTVGEVAARNVLTCSAEDDVQDALRAMASRQVRRLPVVDKRGTPIGILSVDDIVMHGGVNKWTAASSVPSEEIIGSLKQLYGQKYPIVQTKAAVA
jgi:CBS domain-containing protein